MINKWKSLLLRKQKPRKRKRIKQVILRINGQDFLQILKQIVQNIIHSRYPYSIKSDNENYTVDMEFYNLPALYQYYCVPKIDKGAFLIANIIDWEKYNLLEGEANVFLGDTYIDKTLMDKKVSVKREKIKDFTSKQFIGNKKEETRTWETTVKNNKNQAINMIIIDQVPVSTIEEIEVDVQNTSGAKQNPETGEIKWEFEFKTNDKKEFELKYTVKNPKV
jgi:hypothetical protein